jgi:hypothetical protein
MDLQYISNRSICIVDFHYSSLSSSSFCMYVYIYSIFIVIVDSFEYIEQVKANARKTIRRRKKKEEKLHIGCIYFLLSFFFLSIVEYRTIWQKMKSPFLFLSISFFLFYNQKNNRNRISKIFKSKSIIWKFYLN